MSRSIAGLVLAALSLGVPATSTGQAKQVSLEANPWRGTIGYARQVAEGWYLGGEVGLGIPQIDRTLAPTGHNEDFFDIFHIGPTARYKPDDRLLVIGTLRFGLADLQECSGDCFPGGYIASSVGFFLGWHSLKFGARAVVGRIWKSSQPATGFLSVSPINVVWVHYW